MHQDPESGNITHPVEDHEPSSTTDDQVTVDTEVKVLLLPHTCLHFHPGNDPASESTTAAGTSSQDECHSQSCSNSIRTSASADRLSHTSTTHDTEMQALMSAQMDEDEDDEGEDEGFDERHRCAHRGAGDGDSSRDGGTELGADSTRSAVRVPEEKGKSKVLGSVVVENY